VSEHLADGEWVKSEDSGYWRVAAVEGVEVAHYHTVIGVVVAEKKLVWRQFC
jgi:hypothetical protein